jgi:alpha-tubulin suppressor-like RCC1 family protein
LGQVRFGFWTGSSETAILPSTTISTGTWYHLAFVHESDGTSKIFIDGVLGKEYKITNGAADGGTFNVGKVQTKNFDGKISNLRITHQALYSNDFIPPREALTTTSQGAIASNVKLLCCQSSTDDTAATVTPNTFSANGTPTPGAETITQSGSLTPSVTWPARVKWKDGVTPTFQERVGGFQVFRFTTGDTGLTYNAWEESKSGAGFNMFAAGSGGGKGMHGNNTAGNVSSPVQVLGGASWRDVSSSQSATAMAIKTDNTLWTWGNPTEGQSGLNSRTKHSSPIQVGTDTTWSNVNRGYNWWYAVKTNGTLWAWGYKTGSVMNDNTTRSSPTQVGTDTNWSIGVGGNNAAALLTKTNGTLWSCGNGEFGVLAQNNHTGYSSPKQVGTDTTWASGENKIGNAYSYSGALKANGTLWMWGLNGNGTLGQNNRSQRSSPVQVGTDTTWTQFSTLPGTGAMGLKTDGTLWVWGGNQQGVLGLNEANPAYRSSPTQLPGTNWSNFGAFGAGNKKAACLKSDGTWWSWGYQMWGEFGINQGNTSLSGAFSSPVQLPGTYVDFASDTYNSFWLKA